MFFILFITYFLFDKSNCGSISIVKFNAYLPEDTSLENEQTTLKLNKEYLIYFGFNLKGPYTNINDYLRIDIQGFKSVRFMEQSNRLTSPEYVNNDPANPYIKYNMNFQSALFPYYLQFYISTGASIKPHSFDAFTYNTIETLKIDKMDSPKTFIVDGGTITFDISVPNKRSGEKSYYSINLKFTNALSEDDTNNKLTFPLPTNAILGGSSCLPATLICSHADNLITVTNLNANTQQIISIEFINPQSSSTSITFSTFISYIGPDKVDQSSTSQTVAGFNDGKLTVFTVESGSLKVGQNGSNIKYKFTTLNQIITGSQIELTLPDGVAWDTTPTPIQCSLDETGSSCTQTLLENQVLTITITLTNSIESNKQLVLTVNSIKTPKTFEPISRFKLKISKDSVNYDYNNDLGTLTMTQQSEIYLTYHDRTINKNGAKSDYTFGIKFGTIQPKDTKLTFTINGYELKYVNKVRFSDVDYTEASALVVTSTAYTITIQFTTDITSQDDDIIIYNIQNLDSSRIGTITAETALNTYKISSTQSSETIPESEPNVITVTSMVQEQQFLSVVDSYQFIIELTNLLTDGCSIIVIMPDDFQTEMTDCFTAIDNFDKFTLETCQVNSKEIRIKTKTVISNKTIQFRLKNLIRNPKNYSPSYFFQIQTEKNSNLMDKSELSDEKLKFVMKCSEYWSTSYCKECDKSGACLSCYSDTSITSNINLLNNKCQSKCGERFYPDSNRKCQSCPNYCLECTSSSLCQSCIDITTQEIKNGKCVLKCSERQFDFNGICTDCNQNCNTCVDQSTKCTSCGEINNLLYQNKCVSQCPTGIFQIGFSCIACTSPCKTCDTGPTVCLTCVNNYYYKKASFSCVSDCGNRYYKDGIECTLCQEPCNNCSSNTICIDCITGYYFFNNGCVSTIPNGYYLSGIILNKCPDICGNCISETECTSCPSNKYLLSKQCIDNCPDSYYSQNFVCYLCDKSCLQCTSSTLCIQCPENQYHLSGKCYQTCPIKYYPQDYQCLSCQSSCSTCVNGLECKTCPISAPYMLNNLCVQSCQTNYYIKSFVCNKCQNECATCDEKGCLTCIQNYKYFELTCVISCPSGYQDLNNVGLCEKVTDTEKQVISNLQENKYIPVPFTIVSVIMILSVVVAKIQKSETFIPGSAVGLLGLIIVGSWGVLLILQVDYILEKLETYLLVAALGVHLLLNLANLCIVKRCTNGDATFSTWYTTRTSNSCAFIFLNILSVLSFTLTRFYFSRYFGFRFLKCKLSDVENLVGMNIINGLCAFFCCIPALIASVLLAYKDQLREQLFISSIDSFIVTIIFGICLIWETQKEENFFEEINYASVSQSHQVIPEFFQTQRSKQSKRFSFEESLNGQKFNHQEQDEEPSFPKIEESIEYKDPNYSEQPFSKMLQKNSQFSFIQQIPNPKQDLFNRSQEEIVLQIKNNDVSEPLSIGESQRDIQDIQQKQTLEDQQLQKIREEQQRIEFEKQQEQQRQQEEQNKIEEQRKILEEQKKAEAYRKIQEQQRQEEIKKQEQERQVELKRLEDLQKQEEQRLKQEEIQKQEQERIRKEKELQILEEQKKQQELLIQQQQEAKKLEQQKEQERLEQIKEEQRLAQEKQEAQRLEQIKEEERLAELAQQQQIEEQNRVAELKRIEEEQKAERLKQEEEKRIQEELRIKEQEEEAKRIQDEQKKLDEQKIQEELDRKKKEEQLQQLLEEQKLQEQKEQQMIQRSKKSHQSSEIEIMQNEIEDLKQEIIEFDQQKDNKLNDIILVDQDDDDVGWNIENDENDEQQDYEQSLTTQQKKIQKEIIQDDKNDADDDWDVPTSGFVSVQPKSLLRKDQQIEEPVNPFKGYNQRQAPDSDLFKQSRADSDDEDWAANQISPSEFNVLNQRFDHEKHSITQAERPKKFSQTGQNFKSIAKRPTLPDPQINSDNESIDQQSVFDQFARNQLSQKPQKQNQGLNKIYLQRQQIKQKGSNNIGINDIKF
ncbi:unnamed protein product [Paramecium sonneborni]|uniref:EGF-like domain-containing protein n=1 Tax=Paramecium sonneborni TaxID=65129 RepID=A0A8S1M3Y8_9CILI|nr:unnamed protein product [Paramecium sonneborni]